MTVKLNNGLELEIEVTVGCNEEAKDVAEGLYNHVMSSVEMYFELLTAQLNRETYEKEGEDEAEGCDGDLYM